MSENTANLLSIGAVNEGTGSYTPLEDGCYEANLAAITVKMMKKFQSEEMEPKIMFTFQVAEDTDEGQVLHYVRTVPFRNANSEKSTMNALIGSWLKKAPAELTGLNLRDLLGNSAQVVIKSEIKGEKTYTKVDSILPAKKSQKTAIIPDAMPAFIGIDLVQKELAPGMTIKDPVLPAAEPAEPSAPVAPAVPQTSGAPVQNVDAAAYMAPKAEGEDKLPFNQGRV